MPTPALIHRGGSLERLSQALWQVSRDEPEVWSHSRREVDAALEAHRLEIARYHQQQDAKFAALNARLQARRQLAGNN